MKIEQATKEEINELKAKFKKFNVDLLEEPSEYFSFVGIMDVYNYILSEQGANDLLGYNEHNLRYNSHFQKTFTQLFNNEKEVYVHVYKKGLSKEQFKFILSSLNRGEASFFRKLFTTKKGIYKIKDEETLSFFVKLSTKEIYFSTFFFYSLDTVVVGITIFVSLYTAKQ